MKTAMLHIGLPKTGSTSLQNYLYDHAASLQRQDAALYRSDVLGLRLHAELHLSSLRKEVSTDIERRYHLRDRAELRERTRESIARFVSNSEERKLIFSSEGLSFLRTQEECLALRGLFPETLRFRIILVLRERDEWLQSYTRQICKVPGRLPSRDPLSTMYVEKDTWLTDFDAIIRAYTAVFGGVRLIQYDTAHVLEDVLEAMDLDGSRAIHRYRLNVSSAGGQASPWRRIARKLKLGRLRRSILSLLSR